MVLRTNSGSPEAVDLEGKVEPYASMVVMTKSLIESLLPAVVSLFLGPWSDRGGRKPLLVAAFSGFALQFLTLSLMSNWMMSPWYFLIALIPTNIAGGLCTKKLAARCFISDTTKDTERTVQLALLEVSVCIGTLLGGFGGPWVYKTYGYTSVFVTATVCCTSALVYTCFFIPETVQGASRESIRGLFKLTLIKELLQSFSNKRGSSRRSVIWPAISIIVVNSMIHKGDVSTIEFLFTRARLSWNVQQYSYFTASDSMLRLIGLCCVMLRSHIPGVPDTLLAGLGLVSALGAATTKSLAWQSWHMYLAVCIGLFTNIVAPVIRSVISEVVPRQEIGEAGQSRNEKAMRIEPRVAPEELEKLIDCALNSKLEKIEEDDNGIQAVKRRTTKPGCFFLLGPPTALLYFARILTGTILTDLIVYRTCIVSLENNASDCMVLRTDSGSLEAVDLEARVEPYASMVVMTKSLIESLLPAVVSLFLGPWSDRGGRKPLLVAAYSGFAIQFLTLALMSNWMTSPWYLMIALIPTNIVGGLCTKKLAEVCFISDTTKDAERTVQLALLEVSMCIGNLLGGFGGPWIYKTYGYTSVFGTAAVCCTLALVHVCFFIPETVKGAPKESIRGLFKLTLIKELLQSFSKKRGSSQRSLIWLAMFTIIVSSMIYKGDIGTIEFLFTRARLSWHVQQYSYYTASDSMLRLIGLCCLMLRSHIPGVPDTLLAGLGLVSALGAATTKSLAWQSWHMYLAVCIGLFTDIMAPVIRSVISEVVPRQEIGKVFTFIALLEILSPLVGAPLHTLIYSRYLPPIYPAPVYLLSSALYVLLIICVVRIEVLIKKSRKSHTHKSTTEVPLSCESYE